MASRLLPLVLVPLAGGCALFGREPNLHAAEPMVSPAEYAERPAAEAPAVARAVEPAAAREGSAAPVEAAVARPAAARPHSRTPEHELAIWNDPKFEKRFMEGFLASTDVEPSVTTLEREQMQQVLDAIQDDDRDLAVRMLRKYGTPTASAVFDYTLGGLLFQDEDVEGAVAHYRNAVDKHPNFRRAWHSLGLCYSKLGKYQDAVDGFARVIELGGGDAVMYGLLGYSHANLGNDLSAETAYRQACLLDPETLEWRLYLARALFQQQRFADAAALCGELVAAHPERADFWLLQAKAFIGLGRRMDAAENLEMVDGLGGSTADSLFLLGDIYTNEKLHDAAVGYYARAMDASGPDSAPRVLNAAKALTSQGAFDAAGRLVDEIESRWTDELGRDDRKETLRLRARVAMSVGAGDEEARILEEIVALDPLDGGATLLLGQHAARTGNPEQAIFYYERAAALEEFEAEAKVRHAQVLVGQNRLAEALPLLRRAQTLDPKDNVQEYLEQVERIAKARN